MHACGHLPRSLSLALQADQIDALQRKLAAALAGNNAANGAGGCNGGPSVSGSQAAAVGNGPVRGRIFDLDMVNGLPPWRPLGQEANGNGAAAADAAAGWPAAAHATGAATANVAGGAKGRGGRGMHLPRVGKGAGGGKQHYRHSRGRSGRGHGRGAAGDAA